MADSSFRLKPSPLVPGVWQTDNFEPGRAAVHALIIGVSRYPNLVGEQSLGMKQLAVSALTAFRFFLWLGRLYRPALDPPPMKVRLLLSPTEEESQLFPSIGQAITVGDAIGCNAQEPHLMNLFNAGQAWFNDAQSVRDNVADSRLVFFFSGHGLEIDPDQQLLLPSDYAYTPVSRMNVLSTDNIRQGMSQLAIARQYYFIDACRSDIPAMHDLSDVSGIQVIPESRQRNRRVSAPFMLATVTGDVTYQPAAASAESLSFFGQALLDALEVNPAANPPFTPATIPQAPAPAILWLPLYQFATASLRATIASHPELPPPVTGPVSMGGINEDPIILSLVTTAVASGEVPVAPPPPPMVAPPLAPAPAEIHAITAGGSVLRSFGPVVHGIVPTLAFGSSVATQLFSSARVGRWVGVTATGTSDWEFVPSPQAFDIVDLERTGDARHVRVHVSFKSGHWHWLELTPGGERTFAFLIPDAYEQPIPIIAFDIALAGTSADALQIADIQAFLSLRNTNAELARAAELHAAYRAINASVALRNLEPTSELVPYLPLEDSVADMATLALRNKMQSGIAASVGALVLLKGGLLTAESKLLEWLNTLADRFPYSDAAVLALQVEMQLAGGSPSQDVLVKRMSQLANNGAPFTAEAFSYLVRIIDLLSNSASRRTILPQEVQAQLPPMWQKFLQRIEMIKSLHRGTGLFTNFLFTSVNADKVRNVIG